MEGAAIRFTSIPRSTSANAQLQVNQAGELGLRDAPPHSRQDTFVQGVATSKAKVHRMPADALPHAEATQVMHDIAVKCGLPNAEYGAAGHLRNKFPHLKESGFRHDSVFAVDPNSEQGKRFYQLIQEYAADNDLALVGVAMVNEFNHPFAIAPVTADGQGGKLLQMDATDPEMGAFGDGSKTRCKPADPNDGKVFNHQVRALWLIPRDAAIEAGNAKWNAAKIAHDRGVNCAEFATGLLHHLHNIGVLEFAGVYAAHKAYRHPTGLPEHRGFAAGLMLAVPHMILLHTDPSYQSILTDPANGARVPPGSSNLHTGPINLMAEYQSAEG